MIEYIKGRITSLSPAHVIIETGGLGYFVNISLSTFTRLENMDECSLLVHEIIREDAHLLFGFFEQEERSIFRLLISVSGVGANTARMMLSSVEASGIERAILESDVGMLKGIKGIGAKTAQRIIVDLKDKVGKSAETGEIFMAEGNTIRQEAFTALVMLGFPKNSVNRTLEKLVKEDRDLTVEQLIKKALKIL
ncbi:MAG: Holliday junction branch migration protein RuvA [Bacteroidales bacterium]|jgi:Holliday junction DNA helicase RuvA|nr:Holliday junction branch migration protein RuvA [Bacteroidales bacterium]